MSPLLPTYGWSTLGIILFICVCSKLFVVNQELASAGSKTQTPTALRYNRFEEWSQGNQEVYKLQSQILDLEAAKIR